MADNNTWLVKNVSPAAREWVEGAISFVLPTVLIGITDALGGGTRIDWKVLAILCLGSLATYIRTRPTKH